MLARLNEYKELIGIMVFFLGGFLWVQTQYPTKTDLKSEIGVLNCLLEKYMTLTQLQIRGRDLERQWQELSNQITAYADRSSGASITLSPAMKQELEDKKSELLAKKGELKATNTEMQKISDELARNLCGKR